jgi:hypothetical protein
VFRCRVTSHAETSIANSTSSEYQKFHTLLSAVAYIDLQGHQPSPTGFIMVSYSTFALSTFDVDDSWEGSLKLLQGHEFTGTIEETGSEVKNFQKGDHVVAPFTVSWSAMYNSDEVSSITDQVSAASAIIASMDFLRDVPRVCSLEQQPLMGPKPNMFAFRSRMPLQ